MVKPGSAAGQVGAAPTTSSAAAATAAPRFAFNATAAAATTRGVTIAPSIAYGLNAGPGQFPSIVSLQYEVTGGTLHGCGGTLIAPNLVLTAAHCIVSSGNVPRLPSKLYVGGTIIQPSRQPVIEKYFEKLLMPMASSSKASAVLAGAS